MGAATYFPVSPRPLRMRAGLQPFPSDHGNGLQDQQFFQIDDSRDAYRAARTEEARARCGAISSPTNDPAHQQILEWIRIQTTKEHPELGIDTSRGSRAVDFAAFDRVVSRLQEDIAIIRRRPGSPDALTLIHVCFPSNWRPEQLLGRSFQHIHTPVPGFAQSPGAAANMVSAMIERDPSLRFVWSLSPDGLLDHHPSAPGRSTWDTATHGWMRVERQVTVGFPRVGAALFLIRTYLRRFDHLRPERRAVLAAAVRAMPLSIREYKGFRGHEATILRLLEGPTQ